MKKVLFVAHFMDALDENTNNRFNYIIQLLKDKCELEVITSDYSHRYKRKRKIENEENKDYKITFIKEMEYKRNISLKRFLAHYTMALKLKKYLLNLKYKPDVIYCAVPSLDVAKTVATYARKNKIKFIIDVQDLWPEAFKLIFNIPIISNIMFFPMKKQADYIYSMADDIVAVSNTYADRVSKVNKKYRNKIVVFLGTDLQLFDKYKNENTVKSNDDMIRIAYVGTLGNSYDITSVIKAINILNERGFNNLQFVIIGDGPKKEEFKEAADTYKVNCKFIGYLSYPQMVGKLCSCDIAVNPIKSKSAGSIINKVGDYAAAGLPVINTQNCEEYKKLIEQYDIGYNCRDCKEIADAIQELLLNRKKMNVKGKNNRVLAETKFDRKVTYNKIVEVII